MPVLDIPIVLRSADASWRALRQRRADPPAPAKTADDRTATFRAGLEQAEQQLRAAASTGYDSRALNLFYGLSQDGRALAAAAPSLRGEQWKLRGHGPRAQDDPAADIASFAVEPGKEDQHGSFVCQSTVLGSPLTQEITVGELWHLIPETTWLLSACGAGRPRSTMSLGDLADPDASPFERRRRYRGHGMGEAMALSADEAALHPLMVWWQMLFAMSMLNRYHPAGWTQMIDLDSSPRVVAIEHLPDVASRQETRSVRLANHGSRCCASRLGP